MFELCVTSYYILVCVVNLQVHALNYVQREIKIS